MKMEKILFPTKFQELAFNCLESLFALRRAGLREVLLCHIIERDQVGFVPFGGYLKEEAERLREEARIRFEDWRAVLSTSGIGSKVVIEVGDPVHKILSLAESEGVDLMVVGRKKRTLADALAGSRTLELLRRSPVPVLVNKYMVEFEWGGEVLTRVNDRIFEKPLLATDWTPPSERALALLASLRGVVEKAAVCHVLDVKPHAEKDMEKLKGLEEKDSAMLARYCGTLEKAGIRAEAHLAAGHKDEEIMRVARESRASMIVMGTTGKDRLHELWQKSVSHNIAKSSELPTLLVQ
jgi:nucleotide-binding universal stress UspA family protein